MIRKILLAIGALLLTGWLVISILVELEGDYVRENLGGDGRARALVLFHPSRDARFSDDISMAFAKGLQAAGFDVERATLTGRTPAEPRGYAIIGVVSNTYYWMPDLPTVRYLERAHLDGIPVVGLIGGAGSTGRAERLLHEALRGTGAADVQTRSFWLWRPNDKTRTDKPNREIALDLARQLGLESGRVALLGRARGP